jgi:hypothetical protein
MYLKKSTMPKIIQLILFFIFSALIFQSAQASGTLIDKNPPINFVAQRVEFPLLRMHLTWEAPEKSDMDSALLTGYKIYRRAYNQVPAGQDPNLADTTGFKLIAIISDTSPEYNDTIKSLDSINCFTYYVTAVYSEIESDHSNVDWDCLMIPETPQLTIFPNPSTTYIVLQSPNGIKALKIYNLEGTLIADLPLSGEILYTYQFEQLERGYYCAVVITNDGKSVLQIFMKQ